MWTQFICLGTEADGRRFYKWSKNACIKKNGTFMDIWVAMSFSAAPERFFLR
jgi:hypothetical protein